MKNRRQTALLSFILLAGACALPHHVETPKPVTDSWKPTGYDENKEAVVQVVHTSQNVQLDPDTGNLVVDDSGQRVLASNELMANGAVVDVNGLVLTSNHALSGGYGMALGQDPTAVTDLYQVCVVDNAGNRDCTIATLVAADANTDLAYVATARHFPKAVEFAADSDMTSGAPVYLWGNVLALLPPSGFFGTYAGKIDQPYYTADNFPEGMLPLMLVDINLSNNAPGTPLFNNQGKCVGMGMDYSAGNIVGSRSLPFFVPVEKIMEFAKENPWTPPKD